MSEHVAEMDDDEYSKQDYILTIRLNSDVTGPAPDEALQREFADWYPGPVLLKPGTEVRYGKLKGNVVSHTYDDPRIVTVLVNQNAEDHEELKVLRSKLHVDPKAQREGEQESRILIESLLTPPANFENVTVIGYSQYLCDDRLQREYWLSLDAAKLNSPLSAGQVPIKGYYFSHKHVCTHFIKIHTRITRTHSLDRVYVGLPLFARCPIHLRKHTLKNADTHYSFSRSLARSFTHALSITNTLAQTHTNAPSLSSSLSYTPNPHRNFSPSLALSLSLTTHSRRWG